MLLSEVIALYVGDVECTKAYIGETLVYSRGTTPEPEIDVSALPEYWQSDVTEAFSHVVTLGRRQYVHNLVMADMHYNSNYGHSIPILNALYDTGYFSKVLFLGDILDTGAQTELDGMVEDGVDNLNGNILYVVGNHDHTGIDTYPDDDTYVHASGFVSAFMDGETLSYSPTYGESHLNYYCDDTAHKIRYYCLSYGHANDELDWLCETVSELSSDWTWFILHHFAEHSYSTGAPITLKGLCGQIALTDAQFGGWLHGHYHYDRQVNGAIVVDQTGFACDRYGDSTNPRTDDSTESQSITIMSINKTSKIVKYYRIGSNATNTDYGEGMEWQYTMTDPDSFSWTAGYSVGTTSPWGFESANEKRYILPHIIDLSQPNYFYWAGPEDDIPTYMYCGAYVDKITTNGLGRYELPYTKRIQKFTLYCAEIDASVMSFSDTPVYGIAEVDFGTVDANRDMTQMIQTDDITNIYSEFDPSDFGWGYVSTSGTIVASTSERYYTKLIKVEPETEYTFANSDAGFDKNIYIGFYTDPLTFISGSRQTFSGGSATFTTPSGCNYIGMSYSADGSSAYDWTMTFTGNSVTIDLTQVYDLVVTAEDTTVAIGRTLQLSATCYPQTATDQSVTWSSSDTSLATVDSTGLVTGVATGDVTITATSVSNPSVSATYSLTVTEAPITTTPTTLKSEVRSFTVYSDGGSTEVTSISSERYIIAYTGIEMFTEDKEVTVTFTCTNNQGNKLAIGSALDSGDSPSTVYYGIYTTTPKTTLAWGSSDYFIAKGTHTYTFTVKAGYVPVLLVSGNTTSAYLTVTFSYAE